MNPAGMDETMEAAAEEHCEHCFGAALEYLKNGRKVARNDWNGKGVWLELQKPDTNSKMTFPYIYMKTACDNLVPWSFPQTDVLAEDWKVIP